MVFLQLLQLFIFYCNLHPQISFLQGNEHLQVKKQTDKRFLSRAHEVSKSLFYVKENCKKKKSKHFLVPKMKLDPLFSKLNFNSLSVQSINFCEFSCKF